MADEAGASHFLSHSLHNFLSVFTTGSFTKDDRGDYFSPNISPIRLRLPIPKRLMVAFVLSPPAHHAFPLPSASLSTHSQSTQS